MNKFKGILICTDLDGTLLRRDKTISEENLRAIEYFKSEGGLFTYVTGRMPKTTESIYKTVNPNAPFGCNNGGGIYDHKKGAYVWIDYLPREALELVVEACEKMPTIGAQVSTPERIYFCYENAAMEGFRRATGAPNLVAKCHEITEPLCKALFGAFPEEIPLVEKFLKSHPRASEFDFIRSEQTLYEILPKGNSKGTVLVRLAEYLGIDMKRTVAIGDYDNDVSMLKVAGLGVAVANASESAKAAADHITVHHEQDAIARVIYDIDNGTIKV
jgi:Cof subfamily protein (haloacid dehalogenase superfamily)